MLAKIAPCLGMKEVEVNLKGPGAGRESAVRGLQSAGLIDHRDYEIRRPFHITDAVHEKRRV